MSQATGTFRYGPDSPTVPRRGFWAILACDWDWFNLYGRWAEQAQRCRWARVIDLDRVFNGQYVDSQPRLGIIRPALQPPAWGPHISIVRGERPTQHLDLWNLGVELGDRQSECSRLVCAVEQRIEKISILEAAMQNSMKPKFRSETEAQIANLQKEIRRLSNREKTLRETHLPQMQRDWLSVANPVGVSFVPGGNIPFDFTEMHSDGNHWWFDVQAPILSEFRKTFGLSPMPSLPFHLTFAVKDGTE